MIASETDADGDEGLGGVAKQLRKEDKKNVWSHCVGKQRSGGKAVVAVGGERVMDAG